MEICHQIVENWELRTNWEIWGQIRESRVQTRTTWISTKTIVVATFYFLEIMQCLRAVCRLCIWRSDSYFIFPVIQILTELFLQYEAQSCVDGCNVNKTYEMLLSLDVKIKEELQPQQVGWHFSPGGVLNTILGVGKPISKIFFCHNPWIHSKLLITCDSNEESIRFYIAIVVSSCTFAES